MVDSFIDAAKVACIRKNIKSGFEKSGLAPCDRSKPLNSKYFAKTISIAPKNENLLVINNKLLSGKEMINLIEDRIGQKKSEDIMKVDIKEICANLSKAQMQDGIPLTQIPDLFRNGENEN